jgi:hypothetical protein
MRFVIAKRRGMHEFLSGCRSSKPNVPIRRNVRFQGIVQLAEMSAMRADQTSKIRPEVADRQPTEGKTLNDLIVG